MAILKKIFTKENTEKENANQIDKLRMLIGEKEEVKKEEKKQFKKEKKSFKELLKSLFSGKKKEEEKRPKIKPKRKVVQKRKTTETLGLKDMIKSRTIGEQKSKIKTPEVKDDENKSISQTPNPDAKKEVVEDPGEKLRQLEKDWGNKAQTDTEITTPIITIEEKSEEIKEEPKTIICERCKRVLEIPRSEFTTRLRCVCGRRFKIEEIEGKSREEE